MKIKILPSALNDPRNARRFYERQEQGIGDNFQDSLFSDIDSLIISAGVHSKEFGYFRLLSKRFPYAVYYKLDGEDLAVVSRVLGMRADPENRERKLT